MFPGNNQSLKRCVSFPVNGDPRMCAHIFFFFLFCSVFSTSCYRWFVLYFIKSVSRPLVNGSRIVLILFQSVVVHDIYPPRYICRDYFEAWPFISSRLVTMFNFRLNRGAREERSVDTIILKLSDLNVKEKSISESVFLRGRSILFNLLLQKKEKKEREKNLMFLELEIK